MGSLPFRFLTPWIFRPFRRLRNSLRSNILGGPLLGLPSKVGTFRLNLQRSLHPSPKSLYYRKVSCKRVTRCKLKRIRLFFLSYFTWFWAGRALPGFWWGTPWPRTRASCFWRWATRWRTFSYILAGGTPRNIFRDATEEGTGFRGLRFFRDILPADLWRRRISVRTSLYVATFTFLCYTFPDRFFTFCLV